jgi:cbb3-type cytochrome oxidase cytochrome c subunit
VPIGHAGIRIHQVTEMDALVAYLQILGRLTDAAHKQEVTGGIK